MFDNELDGSHFKAVFTLVFTGIIYHWVWQRLLVAEPTKIVTGEGENSFPVWLACVEAATALPHILIKICFCDVGTVGDPDLLESEESPVLSRAASGVHGGGEGGGGGEREPGLRLRSRLRSKALAPSVPRKTSGAAPSSSFCFGSEAGVAVVVAALLLERRAARWLALDATRIFLARLVGWEPVIFRPLMLAAVGLTAFTASAVAAGDAVAGCSSAGWDATAAAADSYCHAMY